MKHILTLLCAGAALFLAAPAFANDPATGGGTGNGATVVTEGGTGNNTPTTPAQPVPPLTSAKKEEEEDQKPGFVKRVLMAATGNKTLAATITDKDARIAALEKENAELKQQVETQGDDLSEATEWIQGVANGTIDPVAKPAPNPVAAVAAEAVKTNVSNNIRRTGVPVENLQPATRRTITAELSPASCAAAKEEARLTRLDAIWKDAGYDRAAATAN